MQERKKRGKLYGSIASICCGVLCATLVICSIPLCTGCVSEGAGWTFGVQTAGLTVRYENRADSDGEYKFKQSFDPDGVNILTGGIQELRTDPNHAAVVELEADIAKLEAENKLQAANLTAVESDGATPFIGGLLDEPFELD